MKQADWLKDNFRMFHKVRTIPTKASAKGIYYVHNETFSGLYVVSVNAIDQEKAVRKIFDSRDFYHKSDIPNLQVGIKQYKDPVENISDLPLEENEVGDARKVMNDTNEDGLSYIWLWNGEKWGRTVFHEFPKDVATKQDVSEVSTDLTALEKEVKSNKNEFTLFKADTEEKIDTIHQDVDDIQNEFDEFRVETDRILAELSDGKVDDAYVDEDGYLYLTANGVPVTDGILIPAGGGGGGGGTGTGGVTFRLSNLVPSNFAVAEGYPAMLHYNFKSVYTDDEEETGTGTATYYVNNVARYVQAVNQGETLFDISTYLSSGTNSVKVTVEDALGSKRSLTYTVNLVSVSITSSYDLTTVNNGDAAFRYTPVGRIDKTIYFYLDNVLINQVKTANTGRQMTELIPHKPHGVYRLRVYFEATVGGAVVRSNELVYDLMFTDAGNNTILIVSPFNLSTVKQYTNLAIPFVVHNPASAYTDVALLANGTIVSTIRADQRLQTWAYKPNAVGPLSLQIKAGASSKTFNLTITEGDGTGETTDDLELYLNAVGRSNAETNRSEWKYQTIVAEMKNFNFSTDGWITDENNITSLKIHNGASALIPFPIFGSDFRIGGKTIEFEFTTFNVKDYNADIITCFSGGIGLKISANEARFNSEQSVISAKFKEDERVRVSFVIEPTSENRLIYILVNGIISGVTQYPSYDNFEQMSKVGITIGSTNCGVEVHSIRVYANNLTRFQVLDNYIADMDNLTAMKEKKEFNAVYDAFGNISYALSNQKIPCLIIEGELPAYKGDKKTCKMYYNDVHNPEHSWSAEDVQNDVQGTSSQYYPRKNFKAKFKSGFNMTYSGVNESGFKLHADSIPVNVFCFKADFAESSGVHNTGIAVLANDVLKELGMKTPPQATDKRVRTTIDGFPILLFHREDKESELKFVGKYNFNNDKSTEETFGFSGAAESWEFRNNTSDRSLFLSSDFSTDDWKNDFEARYPEDNENYANLKRVMDWVVSTKGNTAKFKSEVSQHFNVDNLLFYWTFTELFGMVDQRAKNQFLTTWGNEGSGFYKWYFILYDNDTVLGINNEGANIFNFSIESQDKLDTGNVWNGARSLLWQQVEACFSNEIKALYQKIRQEGILSYEKVMQYLNTNHSEKWSETVYNQDGVYKYIEPLTSGGDGSYLYGAQGARREHRKWWVYNRFKYMDARFDAGSFRSDYITMRLYTPATWGGVKPNPDFTITPFQDQYIRLKFGSYIKETRAYKNQATQIVAPGMEFNDTETIIYGGSTLRDIGDLSSKYAGTVDVSRANKLTRLIIGSRAAGYENTNLTTLSVGNNPMLEVVDVTGCPELKGALDLSGCIGVREIYASKSGISALSLARGGIVETAHLPGITSLMFINQLRLQRSELVLDSWDRVTSVWIENCPLLDGLHLMGQAKNLSRVRLVGLDETLDTDHALRPLLNLMGMDANGNNTSQSVVEGKIHFKEVSSYYFDLYKKAWPDLVITYTDYTKAISFKDVQVRDACIKAWGHPGSTEFTYEQAAQVTEIDRSVFITTNMTSFDELEFFINLKTIGDNVFSGKYLLRSIKIPPSVEVIGKGAFNECVNLTNISPLPRLTAIPGSLFKGCVQLNIDIARDFPNVTSIGANGIRETGITRLDLSNIPLANIQEGGLYGLKKVTEVVFFNDENLTLTELPKGQFILWESWSISLAEVFPMLERIEDQMLDGANSILLSHPTLKSIYVHNIAERQDVDFPELESGYFYKCNIVNARFGKIPLRDYTTVFTNCNNLESVTMLGQTYVPIESYSIATDCASSNGIRIDLPNAEHIPSIVNSKITYLNAPVAKNMPGGIDYLTGITQIVPDNGVLNISMLESCRLGRINAGQSGKGVSYIEIPSMKSISGIHNIHELEGFKFQNLESMVGEVGYNGASAALKITHIPKEWWPNLKSYTGANYDNRRPFPNAISVEFPASLTYISGVGKIAQQVIVWATTPPRIYGPYEYMEGFNIYVPDESVTAYKEATGWKAFAGVIKGISELPTT